MVGIIRGLAENNLAVADELFRELPEGGFVGRHGDFSKLRNMPAWHRQSDQMG